MTEDDFKEWLLNPVTKMVIKWHKRLIEDGKDAWVGRDFVRGDVQQTALVNAEALGKIQGIALFVGLAEDENGYESMMADLRDE